MSHSPNTPSPRELRDRRSKRLVALGVSGFLGLGIVAGSAFVVANTLNLRLGEDLCPRGRAPVQDVIVFLDATDPWNPTQQAVMHEQFRRIQETTPRFARVHLYALDPHLDGLPEPVLVLCNPGRPEDFGQVPVLGERVVRVFANPARLEEIWQEAFAARLDSIFQDQAEQEEAPASPIMETLRGAAIQAASSPDRSTCSPICSSTRRRTAITRPRAGRWTTRAASPGWRPPERGR